VVQNGEVSRLLHIGAHGTHQPQGVVVEAAADVVVAPLGQGLILMIGGAVGELDGGNVQNPLPGTLGDNVHEAVQVLTGIPEAHAPAGAGLIVAGGAAQIEGDHALILVPDIHHPVQLFLPGAKLIAAQQAVPIAAQGCKGSIYGSGVGIFCRCGVGVVLADNAGG